MKRFTPLAFLFLLTLATRSVLADEVGQRKDLRRAVPADSFLVVHGSYNPERDYQRVYSERVFETICETRFIERCVESVTLQMTEDDRERALEWLEELKTAAAPIDVHALLDSKEVVYAQRMEPFEIDTFQVGEEHGRGASFLTSQHLLLVRLSSDAARDYQRGIKNILEVSERCCEGQAAIKTEKHDTITLTTMSLPEGPYCPAMARVGDVILLSSSCQFARDSLAMLTGNGNESGKPSKFDDPRLAEALRELPEAEDAVVFYDGRLQFDQLREMVDTLHRHAGDNPEVDRWVNLTTTIFDELAILDYVAAVEYTDGNRNCEQTLGKLLPHSEHRLLTEMLDGGEPFVDWHRWVPADATAYSLSPGANFHAVYEHAVRIMEEQLPELHQPLENFEKWQRQIDLHLDVDLLQAFSGECVSVTLPTERSSAMGGQDFVWAMRCHKPARIGWLIERLVDHLNQYPLIKMQGLRLADSEDLVGFQEVSAAICGLFGMQPVVGIDEGWMFVGSSAEAVQKVLLTRAGQLESIAETPAFKQFKLEVDGPVRGISFVNLAQQTRQIAKVCQQAGAVMPMVVGWANAQAGTDKKMEELVPLRVMAELLPSLGKIIGEFDFLESQLTMIQDGAQPGTWREYRVTLIRPAEMKHVILKERSD